MANSNKNKVILELLLNGEDLNEENSRNLMISWLNDQITPVQTGALLAALRIKKSTGIELASMAGELIRVCDLPIERPDLYTVDTCGTGGDGANTFNISTAVAFVAASCGVNIAKHGNRSASGKVGSADVLATLGLNLNAPLEKIVLALKDIGITFLYAPAWHKSLIKLAPLRKALGIRTIFNQLGPLVNPIRPDAQVLGVASEDLLEPMASALKNLGMKKAIVVYGYGGLDEASLEGENKLIFVDNGKINPSTLNISNFKFDNYKNEDLVVSVDQNNEVILKNVLSGTGKKSHILVVALNAALVLWAAGFEENLEQGIKKCLNSINQGLPWQKFLSLKSYLED